MIDGPRMELLSSTLTKKEVTLAKQGLSLGDHCSNFAAEHLYPLLKARFNAKSCHGFMGGRASLFAVIQALSLQPGDEILVPAFTCQAVTNALTATGAVVVFVDIEPETYGMSADLLLSAITPRSRVLFIQYTFGLICKDLTRLLEIAKQHHLRIIEDCAHALGARYQNQEVGRFGDIAFFSSERSKLINTIHGGFVITHDQALADAMDEIVQQARLPPTEFTEALLMTLIHDYYRYAAPRRHVLYPRLMEAGLNQLTLLPQMFAQELQGQIAAHYHYRMPDIVAKIIWLQLKGLPQRAAVRQQNAMKWQRVAQEKGWQTPVVIPQSEPAWLRYPVVADLKTKEKLKTDPYALAEMNAAIGVWFTSATHPAPIDLPNCPIGTYLAQRCINFPTY
ncbi:aminotransferase class I/II-fold pyridoxal phosphate-dependent enzyme [Photobacterium sp. GJ3]|uniref:DegT/DnrJ/EryC1/StrS family aminotransferase n=1 Tax=Photobacterium sp. GJ3 TaxID=2829502 RepID=UPI001B8D99CA|nr:aminotransferase class I/II-fold pyridoxal phosphate-dependent enzyme [Photobacterium sp. GJ3]QUJ67968.1 aminotransferase class I/II-fold pyridoxal phosphate-dependent enzyme [Photobacterium sp. GJ3]